MSFLATLYCFLNGEFPHVRLGLQAFEPQIVKNFKTVQRNFFALSPKKNEAGHGSDLRPPGGSQAPEAPLPCGTSQGAVAPPRCGRWESAAVSVGTVRASGSRAQGRLLGARRASGTDPFSPTSPLGDMERQRRAVVASELELSSFEIFLAPSRKMHHS